MGIGGGSTIRDDNLRAPMLAHQLEQRASVLGTETHTAVTGRATKLADGGRTVDGKPALEEQSVRHRRHMVLT